MRPASLDLLAHRELSAIQVRFYRTLYLVVTCPVCDSHQFLPSAARASGVIAITVRSVRLSLCPSGHRVIYLFIYLFIYMHKAAVIKQ